MVKADWFLGGAAKSGCVRLLCRLSLFFLIIFSVCQTGARAPARSPFALGIAPTPAHFPNHSPADVQDMFRESGQLGSFVVFIYQWGQPDFMSAARQMMKMSMDAGLTPILALSPTKLSGMRGELDLPTQLQRSAGRRPFFADRPIAQPYKGAVRDLANLKPPYLCLATEINLLALADIKQYVGFAKIYKEAYHEVKKISPGTQVFVSFQWDVLKAMDVKEPGRVQEWSKMIEIFRPELDLVAFTTYPTVSFPSPASIPADYYGHIYDHIGQNDKVMFMEVGWPTTGKGSEASQAEFIRRLPALMGPARPSIVVWSLLHDVGSGILSSDLATTGLITQDDKRKSGFDAFKQLGGVGQ